MRSSSEPFITSELKRRGVSAVWIRQREGDMNSCDLLFLAASGLRRIIELVETATQPVYIVCRKNLRAASITVPTKRGA